MKGKLIVSTKSSAGKRKTVLLICSIIMYAFGVLILFTREAFSSMGTMGDLLWLVGWIWPILYPTYNLILVFAGSKSYCDVYEDGVSGRTALSRNNPGIPMQDFEISFSEIVNVTNAGKRIMIYTKFATFEVMALQNCAPAVSEIRSRMTGKGD